MNIPPDHAITWLQAKDKKRLQSVQEAADILLTAYRSHSNWLYILPIELHRLAATRNTKIAPIKNMKGVALLIPAERGFRILVNSNLDRGRFRTSVAHELVHTLFYAFDQDVPRRIVESSKNEESFCFDVARRILAPDWHIKKLGITCKTTPITIFKLLTNRLQLSRPIAARLMLQDYCLVQGVAGRWINEGNAWKLQRGYAYASPSLTTKKRKFMSEKALNFLEKGIEPNDSYEIICFFESSGIAAFLIVTIV